MYRIINYYICAVQKTVCKLGEYHIHRGIAFVDIHMILV